jgi:hypothetical protein
MPSLISKAGQSDPAAAVSLLAICRQSRSFGPGFAVVLLVDHFDNLGLPIEATLTVPFEHRISDVGAPESS